MVAYKTMEIGTQDAVGSDVGTGEADGDAEGTAVDVGTKEDVGKAEGTAVGTAVGTDVGGIVTKSGGTFVTVGTVVGVRFDVEAI